LFQGNVLEFFDLLKKEKIFNEIWILFPDPWPKIRHHKRRLLNENFLKKIHSYLKDDGRVMIASDSSTYLSSILVNIYQLKDYFLWKNQRVNFWNYQYLDLPITKFYKKAKKSNRNTMFIELIKI
jgi:tRNA (guanine-N7-)-methyltransferase